jgi:quinol monooxygenase YgiN
MVGVLLGAAIFAVTNVGPSRAQPLSAVLDVTYVEVAPRSEAAAVALLQKHREAGRQEPGNVHLELFQQDSQPDHFVILESWRDQASIAQHGTNAATKAFFDALRPLQVSAVDQRTFNDLSLGSAVHSTAGSPVYVVTHVDTIPNPQRDGASMLRRHAEESRKDEGNIVFDVYRQISRSNHFAIVEVWKDRAALDQHRAAPHTKQYRGELQPLLGSPLDERLFTAVK